MCIYTHTTKNPWHKDVDRQMYNGVWYFCTYPYGLSLNEWHTLLFIANNRHGVTITTHAIKRHFLIWITTVRQPTKRPRTCVLTLKYTFICAYWWTRQRIRNTLIVVDRYMRLMGDKTIPDSAEPFVAGIDLPHQGVVDSYNLHESQVSIYHNQWVVYSLSCSPTKSILYPKTTVIPACCCLSCHSHPTEEVVCCCRCPYGDAKDGYLGCKIMYAIPRDSSPTNIEIYQTQLYICWSTTSRCHGFLITYLYMMINRD